ncbi:uncharacterized protein LOC118989662 [Sturnira hondurensis]|uniref:uncharacterized protein LOC118989662 n=1 Tax=Sturnira hondurensis TaxID=192404 RepID=UPI00187A5519|nr:uncharacterized protein LOC118989662 [Sturnira hondurensis]
MPPPSRLSSWCRPRSRRGLQTDICANSPVHSSLNLHGPQHVTVSQGPQTCRGPGVSLQASSSVSVPCADSCSDSHGCKGWRPHVCSAPPEQRPTKYQVVRNEPPQREGAEKAVVRNSPCRRGRGKNVLLSLQRTRSEPSERAAGHPLTVPVRLRSEVLIQERGTRGCVCMCTRVCREAEPCMAEVGTPVPHPLCTYLTSSSQAQPRLERLPPGCMLWPRLWM